MAMEASLVAGTILTLDPHGGSKDVHPVIDLAVCLCMQFSVYTIFKKQKSKVKSKEEQKLINRGNCNGKLYEPEPYDVAKTC